MRTKFVTIAVLSLAVSAFVFRSYRTNAHQNSPTQPPARTAPNPQDYLSANQQKNEFPTLMNLNCQGCHLGGRIPDIKGDTFHKDARTALDESVHAVKKADGHSTCD